MPRILLSLGVVAAGLTAIYVGGTSAFFSDTETSTGNTFAAGAIDLKVDNDSYYNRNRCAVDAQDINHNDNTTEYVWQGTAAYPVPGTACDTSFGPSDLDKGLLFFNFRDLKPDDEGEDTISLHAQNDAYVCMDLTLTSNDDVSSTDPELAAPDVLEDPDNTWDGELAQKLEFFWWADDGDNVYEQGENALTDGVENLYEMAYPQPFSVALADSQNNVWHPQTPGPIPANQTMYIGKAWCFGTLTLDAVPAGQGVNPSVNPGVVCDGTLLGNETQTDAATVDVAFRAVQARHNPTFTCGGGKPRLATITVTKHLVLNDGGNEQISDFLLYIDDGINTIPVTSGVPTVVPAGNYTVTETGVQGYNASFSGPDCDSSGNITLANGDNKSCNLTNDDIAPNITLVKKVIGTPPLANATLFGLSFDGKLMQNNTSTTTTANSVHTINEAGRAGYTFVGPITGTSSYGKACPAVLGGTITLDEGETIVCTITNAKN